VPSVHCDPKPDHGVLLKGLLILKFALLSHFHDNFIFIILLALDPERDCSGKVNIGDLLLRHTFLKPGMVQYHI
jgi:hypothetical protein